MNPSAAGGALISYGDSYAGAGQEYILTLASIEGTTYLFGDGLNSANNIAISGSEIPPAGVWSHVAFTLNGSNGWTYFLNGVAVKSGTFSVPINTATPTRVTMGNRSDRDGPSRNAPLAGMIDEVRIWNQARSQAQIQASMNRTLSPSTFGLVGYWGFNEGTGTPAKDPASGNHLAITGATWVDGRSLRFDGIDDYVNLGNAAGLNVAGGNQVTLEFWYTPSTTTGTRYILDKQDYSNGKKGYYVYRSAGQILAGFPEGGATWNELASTSFLVPGSTYHIAVVHTGTEQRIYVNGALNISRAQAITITNGVTELNLGRHTYGGNYYESMALSDVRIWNVARSQADIQANMNKPLTGMETGLAGYWMGTEGSGGTVSDRTANGNHGTLYGLTWTSLPRADLLITDGAGRISSATFDSFGRATQLTDPAGRAFTYTYDGFGRLNQVSGPSSYSNYYGYDNATGLLTSLTDPTGRRWHFNYDATGRLNGVQDPAGAWTTISYGFSEVTLTSPLGNATRYGVGGSGELTYVKDPLLNQTSFAHDANFNVTSVTNPLNQQTTITYDAMGNALTVRDALTGTVQTTYNSLNLPLTVRDPLNNLIQFQYDANGNLIRETGPTSAVVQHTYNARGLRLNTVSPVNGTITYAYDAYGNLTSVTDPLNNIARNEYNAAGLPTRTIDPRGNDTLLEYDDLGRLHRTRYAGSLRESEFMQTDAAGRPVLSIDATGGTTTFTYDDAGRLTQTTDPLGRITRAEFDADSRTTAEVDALNNRTTYGYDAAGRVLSVTDPLNNVSRATYDAAGRQTVVTDPANYATSFTYDAVGRVLTVTNPLTSRATYAYDLAPYSAHRMFTVAWIAG